MAAPHTQKTRRALLDLPVVPIYRRQEVGGVQVDPSTDVLLEAAILRALGDSLQRDADLGNGPTPGIGIGADSFEAHFGDVHVVVHLGDAAREDRA